MASNKYVDFRKIENFFSSKSYSENISKDGKKLISENRWYTPITLRGKEIPDNDWENHNTRRGGRVISNNNRDNYNASLA